MVIVSISKGTARGVWSYDGGTLSTKRTPGYPFIRFLQVLTAFFPWRMATRLPWRLRIHPSRQIAPLSYDATALTRILVSWTGPRSTSTALLSVSRNPFSEACIFSVDDVPCPSIAYRYHAASHHILPLPLPLPYHSQPVSKTSYNRLHVFTSFVLLIPLSFRDTSSSSSVFVPSLCVVRAFRTTNSVLGVGKVYYFLLYPLDEWDCLRQRLFDHDTPIGIDLNRIREPFFSLMCSLYAGH